jgi:hypothetical protein
MDGVHDEVPEFGDSNGKVKAQKLFAIIGLLALERDANEWGGVWVNAGLKGEGPSGDAGRSQNLINGFWQRARKNVGGFDHDVLGSVPQDRPAKFLAPSSKRVA